MKYDCLCLFDGILSSDNRMVCFRHKAFSKSDTMAGLTRSQSLILHIACVFSRMVNIYNSVVCIWHPALSLDVGQVGR
jgi:hypothetical protein